MEDVLATLLRFYGLDWLTMVLGLSGMYLISNRDKRGFAINGLACVCSLAVALISGQAGFMVYNVILMALMIKGFLTWNRDAVPAKS